MTIAVWIDDWQMQCCGIPFRVGSEVAWTLADEDPDLLTEVLGDGGAARVDKCEEHHGGVDGVAATEGVVESIEALHCRYAPLPGGDERQLFQTPGSGILTPVTSANGWTADEGDRKFSGYLVRLRPT